MKESVVILGADGRSGILCVETLLGAGYKIRAGVHSGKLKSHPNLKQIKCDVTKKSDIENLIGDNKIVVSLIGHGKNSPEYLQSNAIKFCIDILEKRPGARIISLTGTGVRMTGDTPSLADKILNLSIKLIDPKRVKDGIKHAEILQEGNIDYTILRVLKLTNGKHIESVSFSETGPADLLTPRATVAQAIKQIISEDSFHNSSPIIKVKK